MKCHKPPNKAFNFIKKYYQELSIITFGVIAMNLVFFSDAFKGDTLNREFAAQFGDFVGGYVGTLFLLISVVLLFITFKTQRSSGQELSFETKYFELIKMHRDNVAELQLQNAIGRKVFVLIMREFRVILSTTSKANLELESKLNKKELMHVAYYCLFFGTGPNSSRMLRISLDSFDSQFIDLLVYKLNSPLFKEKTKKSLSLDFVPFEGHQSRLGHYYRHLYQSVSYVDKQTIPIDKYEFVKTLRAQLSTHEQALFLINSLSPVGENWWKKELITKYRLVKNLPPEFFNSATEIDITALFDKGYFEWEN